MAHRVFVSYSQADRDCAFELLSCLEAYGIPAWIAPRDIAPAADWAEAIIDAISGSAFMVLVFSSSSNTSPQVRREVERAIHKEVPVIPVRIENVLPSRSLEFFLSTQHWVDAFELPRTPHYRKLCEHIANPPQSAGTLREPQSVAPTVSRTVHQPRSQTHPTWLTTADQQLLERHLAEHIGPVAKTLVSRAAGRSPDWEQLVLALADEVESERARQQFVEACRRRPMRRE